MQIQWFPGHMTKTKKIIAGNISKMDMVIEICDSRAPLSSRNPLIRELTGHKPFLLIMNKTDLADPERLAEWKEYYKKEKIDFLAVNSKERKSLNRLSKISSSYFKGAKWIKRRPVRAMVAGIPNVGKSTLINTFNRKSKAETGNMPGVTRDLQRIVVDRNLELFDTPGILWHKFEDMSVGFRLAVLGSIKETILPVEQIVLHSIEAMKEAYPGALAQRYSVDESEEAYLVLEKIALKRGLIKKGNLPDSEKAARMVLKELRDGILGPLCLERPGKPEWIYSDEGNGEE